MPESQYLAIIEHNFAVPEGKIPSQFIPDLLDNLGNPDPILRDEQAYPILTVWLKRGLLDAELVSLGDACAAALSHPDTLRRSFSALILCECLQRGRVSGVLEEGKAREWMRVWAQWYPNETDTRSYEDGIGWIHAVAHGADVAAEWARWPLSAEKLQALAQVLEARLRSLPEYLNQTEDDRLALAILTIFSQPCFDAEQLQAWSARYRTLWTGLTAGKISAGAVLAVRTLQSLHTLLHLGANISGDVLQAAHREAALDAVQDALRSVYPYHGSKK